MKIWRRLASLLLAMALLGASLCCAEVATELTRKKKLLEKQKEGKKKMRQLGSVEVPPEAFMAVLKLDSDD